MNHALPPNRGLSISPLCFATLALASACSGYYPLGETSEVEMPLEGDGATGQVGDARVPVGLAPPDITISGYLGELYPGGLASVGDMDGDGRDEMAVSAIDYPGPLGFVQLRYGAPRPSDEEQKFAFAHSGAFLTLPGENWLGMGVTAAGDVDGDGFGDLLLRTQDCDVTEPDEGAYLIYGGPERLEGGASLRDVAVRFVPGAREAHPPPGIGYGCSGAGSLAPAGDLDGDGFDDIVINRQPMNDNANGGFFPDTGEGVYVFYGRSQRFAGEVPLESADAIFHTSMDDVVMVFPRADLDGDGLADLIIGPDAYRRAPPGSFLLRGRAQRFSGSLALEQNATVLAGAYVTTSGWPASAGDLDGDGLTDVVLTDESYQRHLFYGAPGLFADGLDFAQAAASIGESAGYVFPVGDRDGDGDDELLDLFWVPSEIDSLLSADVAFASGSSERLSGVVPFPEAEVTAQAPNGPFPDELSPRGDYGRALRFAVPAGDLDGDGAAELFTTSGSYTVRDDGGYDTDSYQLHVHFGVPAHATSVVR